MEIWKDIPGYEEYYQISNLGNVRSLPRKVKHPKGYCNLKGKILKPIYNPNGYYSVSLWKNHKFKSILIHQQVAVVFLGHKINGHKSVVDHIDNDKSNNNLINLQIITHRENNTKDKFRKGKSSRFTGVCYHKRDKVWTSSIYICEKRIYLGNYKNEIDAKNAYKTALKKHYEKNNFNNISNSAFICRGADRFNKA